MLLEDTRDAPLAATSFSMNMIFFTQGKQFTAGELQELRGEAGFKEIALTCTHGYYALVTGMKCEHSAELHDTQREIDTPIRLREGDLPPLTRA